MKLSHLVSGATAAAMLALSAAPANALDIYAIDTGWYSAAGDHDPTNTNYIVGSTGPSQYRNWFAFDLSGLQGTITSATLTIFGFTTTAPNTYETYDYGGSINALTGGTGDVGAYNDLGSGVSYGAFAYSTADNDQFRTLTLNTSAVADLNSAIGGAFAFGGTAGDQGYVFGFSVNNDRSNVFLTLDGVTSGAIPEPATWAIMILGFFGVGGALRASRRQPLTATA